MRNEGSGLMRNLRMGLKVGLLMVGLLAVIAPPANAQFGDPLALAASGVLVPFFGSGNNFTLLEVAVPVGPLPQKIAPGPPPGGFANLHAILFSATCVRDGSFNIPDTVNGTTLYSVTGGDGLVAIADLLPSGVDLGPLGNPLHTRAYWFNVGLDQFRVLEPIILDNFDNPGGNLWSPMRTGATFFAPQEGTALSFQTTLYLICPTASVANTATSSGFPTTRFPGISTGFAGAVAARVYTVNPGAADHEVFLTDWNTPCSCLTTVVLSGAGAVSPSYTAHFTYTELESFPSGGAFTGYKGMKILAGGAAPVDLFGRLSDGNFLSLRGFAPGSTSPNANGCVLGAGCR